MTEFRVHIHLCSEGEVGGCFTDTQTLGTRPDPATLKALLDEARQTFVLLFDDEPALATVEMSKSESDDSSVLDPSATEKKK